MVAGFHVPVIPLGDVAFRVGAVSPEHRLNVVAKSGVMLLEIATFKVTPGEHSPAVGVNT
ncbi:hypothetical protein H9W95_09835 [Flavobacterium lindanitolerans]|nr:hypothetical protein [Flavobacterium lindanitolerans]